MVCVHYHSGNVTKYNEIRSRLRSDICSDSAVDKLLASHPGDPGSSPDWQCLIFLFSFIFINFFNLFFSLTRVSEYFFQDLLLFSLSFFLFYFIFFQDLLFVFLLDLDLSFFTYLFLFKRKIRISFHFFLKLCQVVLMLQVH